MNRIFLTAFLITCISTSVFAGNPGEGQAFPQGFFWGTAVSAHSVEGGLKNDWTEWEETPGHISDNSKSGPACNHWELYQEDTVWMEKLSADSVLVSLEWSRLEPRKGTFDESAFAHYKARFEALKASGIRPFVVLWDRTFPQWEANYGGLENFQLMLDFARFAKKVGKEFGPLVDDYVTLYDPVQYSLRAFKDAKYPPGKVDIIPLGKANLMLMALHRIAFAELKGADKTSAFGRNPCKVGLVMGMKYICPARPEAAVDVSLAQAALSLSGFYFLETLMQGEKAYQKAQGSAKFKGKGGEIPPAGSPSTPPSNPPAQTTYTSPLLDFIFVKYDGLEMLKFNVLFALMTEKVVAPGTFKDDAGQVIYPAGLVTILERLKKYPVPMFLMAGIADAEGSRRGDFIRQTVEQIKVARNKGCNVIGFFYDPLLCGFEYENGYSIKRGLIDVNHHIQERKAAPGAEVFKALAKSNGAESKPVKLRRSRKSKQ